MREPPDLPNEAIVASVRESYGIPVVSLAFLPIGHDSSAWVYRATDAEGAIYFLKVRRGAAYEPGLAVPRHLRDRGLAHVIAPLPATGGALWAGLGDYALILYPFIDGRTGMEVGLSEEQWVVFGAAVKQVHTAPLGPDVARLVGVAPFAPRWGGAVRDWDAARGLGERVATGTFADPAEHELAAFWRDRAGEIRALIDRAEELGRRLQLADLPQVLCHADLHTGNVLLDREQRLWIVDWDETMLAPKERDLMFVVGGISRDLVGPREEELFFRGYGEAETDPLALSYYRHAWAVQDVADFGEQVFSRPDLGTESKRAAMGYFKGLFEPGNIVDLARVGPRRRVAVTSL
jgi:spectinomycin phosphotransferase